MKNFKWIMRRTSELKNCSSCLKNCSRMFFSIWFTMQGHCTNPVWLTDLSFKTLWLPDFLFKISFSLTGGYRMKQLTATLWWSCTFSWRCCCPWWFFTAQCHGNPVCPKINKQGVYVRFLRTFWKSFRRFEERVADPSENLWDDLKKVWKTQLINS